VVVITRSLLAALLAFMVALVAAQQAMRRRECARWSKFDSDLPTLLTSVASSVRAGIDPLVALSAARQFFSKDSVMSRELAACAQLLSAGGDEYEAIASFARGSKSADVDLFRRCVALSRRHGSGLADPLHRITKVVRQRHSFRRKTRAALAMHRLSAIGIAICAMFIAALQVATNFSGVQEAVLHPVGSRVLMAGGLLIVTGVVWMSRMGKEEQV
jgi:Flp pilus assembly protein TadB